MIRFDLNTNDPKALARNFIKIAEVLNELVEGGGGGGGGDVSASVKIGADNDNHAEIKADEVEGVKTIQIPNYSGRVTVEGQMLDISDTAGVFGFSAFTEKKILIMRTGKYFADLLVSIKGTSNNSLAYFEIPFEAYSGMEEQKEEVQSLNNDVPDTGYIYIQKNTNLIRLYRNATTGTNWTSSGSKGVIGHARIWINPPEDEEE